MGHPIFGIKAPVCLHRHKFSTESRDAQFYTLAVSNRIDKDCVLKYIAQNLDVPVRVNMSTVEKTCILLIGALANN